MKRFVTLAAAATVSIAALLAAGAASASSFAIRSGQSAEGLGMAYAGAASGGIGLGSMAWNPATITMFPGRNSQWNFTYLKANGDYQPTSQTPVRLPTGALVPTRLSAAARSAPAISAATAPSSRPPIRPGS